jgi:CRISPR-associated protein Cas2
MFVVVAYDIPDNRRRTKVMKLLEGYGRHVQESVFECDLEAKDYRQMSLRLQRLMNLSEDNLRFYHLCPPDIGRIETYGVGQPVHVRKPFMIV